MTEILWNLMAILYKRHHVEYHDRTLNAKVLKEYNLEAPGLRPAWANLEYLEYFKALDFQPEAAKMVKHL